MRPCPYCAEGIDDHAQVCPFCNTNLVATGAPPAAIMTHAQTSGKAIASLVCGVLFFFLPAAVIGVIMGHLSLSDIRRGAGRLTGRGLAIAGLSLSYLGISVIPILIIAAIAIPNLLHAKLAANEASAVGSLRIINTACIAYGTKYQSFPPALANLGPAVTPNANAGNLIDNTLTSGLKSGYRFTYRPGPAQDGAIQSYEVHADPINPGVTGMRDFFTDQSGVIRLSSSGPANADSPPIN
jgi:type IV pilus assembly protein PilA